MWQLSVPAWELVLRGIIMYLFFVAALRLFGKRQLGQFTVFDLTLLLLAANAVQPAMTGPDESLLGGLILAGTFFVANWFIGWAALHSSWVKRLVEPPPTVLARNGRWDRRALRREWIDFEEAEAALRRAGLQDISQASLVVLEADGTISVIPKQELQRSSPGRSS